MQRLGLGYEFYKRFIDDDLYYVDKTLLIRDVIQQSQTGRRGMEDRISFSIPNVRRTPPLSWN